MNPKNGYALEFFLGLLNQRAIEFYLRKRGSPFRGGYYSRGTAVVSDVPVPMLDLKNNKVHIAIHNDIVSEVKSLLTKQQMLATASGRAQVAIERQINTHHLSLMQKFYQLWGFTNEPELVVLPGE